MAKMRADLVCPSAQITLASASRVASAILAIDSRRASGIEVSRISTLATCKHQVDIFHGLCEPLDDSSPVREKLLQVVLRNIPQQGRCSKESYCPLVVFNLEEGACGVHNRNKGDGVTWTDKFSFVMATGRATSNVYIFMFTTFTCWDMV